MLLNVIAFKLVLVFADAHFSTCMCEKWAVIRSRHRRTVDVCVCECVRQASALPVRHARQHTISLVHVFFSVLVSPVTPFPSWNCLRSANCFGLSYGRVDV